MTQPGAPSASLGLDVGGGATRWRLLTSGAPDRAGEAGAFSGHVFVPETAAAAAASLEAIAAETGPVGAVVAGVTGLTAGTAEADALRSMIERAFGASRIAVMGDSRLAYLSVFAPGEGLLVYAGTGSIAAHVSRDDTLVTVGGKGVIIDDAGGGHWIATRALRSILRREDAEPGSAWGTPLGLAMAARIGGSDWPSVRRAVYGADRGAVGRLALAAGEAAAAGDAAAIAILGAAGRELAALATALERRVGARPVALAGRAADLSPILFETFAAALHGRSVGRAGLDAAAGAARLASAL
jgi:glucosamine kinase